MVVDMSRWVAPANSSVALTTAYEGQLGTEAGLYRSDSYKPDAKTRQTLVVTRNEVRLQAKQEGED